MIIYSSCAASNWKPAGKSADMHKNPIVVLLALLLALAAGSYGKNELQSNQPATGAGPVKRATAPASVTIPAGTIISVRLDNEISSKTSEEEAPFTGSVARPVMVGARTAIPSGAKAKGLIEDAEPAGKQPGGAELSLRLTSVTLDGRLYPLRTALVSPKAKGKGRTASSASGGKGDITLPAQSTLSFKLAEPLKIKPQP
jgi:hypothetical protein